MDKTTFQVNYDDPPEKVVEKFLKAMKRVGIRCDVEYGDEPTGKDYLRKQEEDYIHESNDQTR